MKNEDNLLDAAAKVFRERQSANPRFQGLFEGGWRVVAGGETPPFGAAETSDFELPHTLRLSRSVESVAVQIGEMPPEPPTLRGRVGAILVQAVRRALFWYTGQIRAFQRLVAEAAGEQAVRRALFWYTGQIRTFQRLVAEAAGEQAVSIQELGRRQQRHEALLADVLDRLTELKGNHERRLSDLEHGLERRIDEVERGYERRWSEIEHGHRKRLDELTEQIARQERQVQEIRGGQEGWPNELQQRQTTLEQNLAAVAKEEREQRATLATRIGEIEGAFADIRRTIDTQGREVRRQIQQERAHLLQQEFRLKMLLREARKGPSMEPGPKEPQAISDAVRCADDALFVDHARAFRGAREEIKSRLAVYVPYFKEAFMKTAGAPALDLGCGRGEWLELLREMNIPARGIDWNDHLVQACREMKLDARQGNIPSDLAGVRDESVSIVSAFHVLEHIAFPDLLEVIDQAVRILKPGGIAIFETPNPSNVLVSSNNFYLDPTHRHPIPSDLLAFVVEARGLCDPKIMPLSPYPDYCRLPDSECPAVQFINDHFYGPQDYGIVAFKP